MAQPVFVQKKSGSGTAVSSLTLTPSGTTVAANTLLIQVTLDASIAFSASGITDSQGNDAFGVPLNNWALLGSTANNGVILYWFVCRNALAITSAVVHLTGATNITACLLEYSGANGIGFPQLNTIPSGQNLIPIDYLSQCAGAIPPSGSAILLGVFTMYNDTFNTTPMNGTVRDSTDLNIPPHMHSVVMDNATTDSGTQVVINRSTTSALAQTFKGSIVLQLKSSDQLASVANVAASTCQCYFLLLSGGLLLNSQPGYSDQPDSALAEQKFSLGLALAKIASNAAFGMVRMEFFKGIYVAGDTVPLPISEVDGYVYEQDEVNYTWGIYSSANSQTGWITGPDSLWYAAWNVDQNTGVVSSEEWYRKSGGLGHGVSNDGFLYVVTVAVRQRSTLNAASSPSWGFLDPSLIKTDTPQSTSLMRILNGNAKWSSLAQESIYMGEFYGGQTVPLPVSAVDGYVYTKEEVTWAKSWRWTTVGTSYTQPAGEPYEQLASLKASITSAGVVTCKVGYSESGGQNYHEDATYGRLSVLALCSRIPRYTVPWNATPWDNLNGANSSFSIGPIDATHPSAGAYGGEYGDVNTFQIAGATIIPVLAGHSYTLKYLSGTHPVYDSYFTLVDPLGVVGTSAVSGSAGTFVSGGTPNTYCSCIGCYTDSAGNIVGTPFNVSNTTTSLTIPAGATQVRLGVNNAYYANILDQAHVLYNLGAWLFSVTMYLPTAATGFAEIRLPLFYPGNPVPASTMKQLLANCNEAGCSPEFFGPTTYSPGSTVSLPTSATDGYTYKRSELKYIVDWDTMIPGAYPGGSSDHDRCTLFSFAVDPLTGAVSTSIYRLEPGGPYAHYTTDGVLSVIVVGFRTSQAATVSAPTAVDNPPSDSGTASTDSSGLDDQINGV
jgi:hypothetical protein